MSATKRYLETVSEREGYGGELTEEFLDRVQAGEFPDTLLVIDRADGSERRFHETDPDFVTEIFLAANGSGRTLAEAERRLRAGDAITTYGFVRLMVYGGPMA